MPNDEYKKLWLHDEDDTVTVIPYTTLDSIKIDEDGQGNFSNFKDSYDNLQNSAAANRARINSLNNQLEGLNKVLYGTEEPYEGNDGDLYIQHGDGKIAKIWQKVNGEWYFFSNGGGAPAITIGNVDVSKKPKINVSITIENYTGDV